MNDTGTILSVLVQNAPGVLSKIAGLFYRTGLNIETLTVGKTHEVGISKIVLSVPTDHAGVEELRAKIAALSDVRSASILDESRCLIQEVLLVRVGFDSREQRMAIMAIAQPYHTKLRSVLSDEMTLEVADVPGILDDFVAHLAEFRILEVSRTGMTAVGPALPNPGDAA
jgi:acetolactate synthase-1/3 small subunit